MRIERFLPAVVLAVAGIYLYLTEQIAEIGMALPISGKVFPRVLSAALAIAGVLWFIETLRAKPAPVESSVGRANGQDHWWVIAAVVVWTGGLYWALQPLGYVLSMVVYLLPLMAYFNRGRWVANIVTSVIFSAASYYLFAHLLGVPLPEGVASVLAA